VENIATYQAVKRVVKMKNLKHRETYQHPVMMTTHMMKMISKLIVSETPSLRRNPKLRKMMMLVVA
jgi:hypothetical protein